MKFFTKSILAAIAFSVTAVPMAQAQQRYDGPRHGQHYSQPNQPSAQEQRRQQAQRPAPQRQQAQRPAPQRHHAHRPAPQRHHAYRPAPSRHHWARGQRVPEWQRRQAVRDYYRYGLRQPARGQQWVRVNNDYLLISLATGIILGMAAGR